MEASVGRKQVLVVVRRPQVVMRRPRQLVGGDLDLLARFETRPHRIDDPGIVLAPRQRSPPTSTHAGRSRSPSTEPSAPVVRSCVGSRGARPETIAACDISQKSPVAAMAPVTLMKLLVATQSPLLVFGARCCKRE